MKPLRLVTLAAATSLALGAAPATASAPVPGPWDPQSAQEQAQAAEEVARAARESARAAAQAAKETVRSVREERQRQWGGEGRGETFGDKLSKVVKVPENATVLVHSFSGSITVSAGGPGEVRVEATKRLHGPGAIDPQLAENTRVAIEERAGRVEIRAWTPRGPRSASVDFDVVVPPTATLELKSMSGDITVTGVKGGVLAESMSGDVTASSLAGTSTLKSVSGNVVVNASAVAGELTAMSVSGDVLTKQLKAKAVTATSVSGNVALQNTFCDRATINTVSGNLEVGGPLAKSARYELKSHSGDVRVILDGKTGFEVEASTWSGSISNDLGIKTSDSGESDEPGPRHKRLRGVYGDGSAQIDVSSFSGTVVFVKAK